MEIYTCVVCGIGGLLASAAVLKLLLRGAPFGLRTGGPRQFHHAPEEPVSRLGGLALVLPFALVYLWALFDSSPARPVKVLDHVTALASIAMFGLGFRDDCVPIGAKRKLLGQVLIAAAAWYGGMRIETFQIPWSGEIVHLGGLGPFLTVFWVVALTNLINLIDGIDGLAGGIGLILMCVLASTSLQKEGVFPVRAASVMAGSLLGFLVFNFPPARIYMGDGGAYLIGCLASLLSLEASDKGAIAGAMAVPMLVLGVPILDTVFTILRRGIQGMPVFRPDKKHLHHRLIRAGFGKRKAVLILYGISCFFLIVGGIAFAAHGRATGIVFGGGFVVCLILWRLSARRLEINPLELIGRSVSLRKETRYALALRDLLAMHAERARSLESVLEDACQMAAKLGFARVVIRFTDGSAARRELLEGKETDSEALISNKISLRLHGMEEVEFFTEAACMSKMALEHLSEITAEAWLNSLSEWRVKARQPLSLTASSFKVEPA